MIKSKIKKISFFFVLLTCLTPYLLYSQGQTGKLVGHIFDSATNEALIGVNVVIEGTTIGASTDINGRFAILNIQPGTYNVVCSMVGYSKTTQTNVVIYIDRTTEITVQMQDESYQLGEVVVLANKSPIIKDRTSSQDHLSNEQIKVAPVEGLRGALDLSAGFQKDSKGDYSVRGSGSYEVNFQVDGVEQKSSNTSVPGSGGVDKADNSWKYDVNPLGVQQLQLITGGFSAEYGNSQAGVVKVVLKEGTPKFSGEFRVEYRPPGQYHYGDYIYDKNNYEWQKWGSVDNWIKTPNLDPNDPNYLKEWIKLNYGSGSLGYELAKERYKPYLNTGIYQDSLLAMDSLIYALTWAHDIWIKNHEPSDEHILGVYDYRQYAYTRYLFGFGGPLGKDPNLLKFYFSGEYKRNPTRLPTPEKIQITQNYILNLTFQPSNEHKFKLKGSFKQYKGGIWSGSSDIRYAGLAFTPPGVSKKYLIAFDPVREEQNIEQSLNWTYTINNNSFLEAILTHQTEKYELAYRYLAGFGMIVDRLDFYDDPNGTVLRNGPWWEDKYYFPPQSFSTNYYQDNRSNNWVLKSDYTSQISESNLFKAGINFSYFELFNNGVNSSFQPNSYVARNGFAEYYTAYPISLSAYVQDRMEYEGMIANFGVRAEAFNYQTGVPLDKFNVLYTGTDGPSTTNIGDPSTENSKTQYILLPRIGVSFPIGENTAFRFHYGHFASMPIFSQALARRTWRGWNTIGNPNLEPKLTINYEVGIQQVIGDNHRLDLALYYNDRTKQVGTQQVASYTGCALYSAGFSNDGTPLYWYNTFVNNIFGSTVGLEVIFETITATNWSYRLSYSLSQTTVGSFGARGVYPDGTRGYATRDYTGEFLASWDRTHNLRALVNYFIKENEGPEIFGIKILENTSISMSYTAQSGNPYTYVTEYGLIDVINNRRYPIETNVDLSISKDIKVDDMRLIFQVRVMNVFDNKILTPLADSYEIADWVENNITYEDPGNDPTRLSYIVAPYRKYLNIPRQIFFTLGIGF